VISTYCLPSQIDAQLAGSSQKTSSLSFRERGDSRQGFCLDRMPSRSEHRVVRPKQLAHVLDIARLDLVIGMRIDLVAKPDQLFMES